MKNLFIPYELALIAKQKGFNEPCIACYLPAPKWMTNKDPHINGHFVNTFKEYFNSKLKPENVAAPLYQQIVDWFRDVHSIRIKDESQDNNLTTTLFCILSRTHINALIETRVADKNYYNALNKAIEEAFKLI